MLHYSSIENMVTELRPAQSVHCMHPELIANSARQFLEKFHGSSYYAIKSNPDPYVLQHLYDARIHHFDVASIAEVKLIHSMFPEAHQAFMNPVKSPEAIRAAYYECGVRVFVTDTLEETLKIQKETDFATDLIVVVRLAMDKGSALCQLTNKFGCSTENAVKILHAASTFAKVGVSFHVGSQTLDPQSYTLAIQKVGDVIKLANVDICVLDVGGGFPTPNLGMGVPELSDFFDVIHEEIDKLNLPEDCEIWSEPGRALSGQCSTLVVRVELRKENVLYINDGSYGNMLEVSTMNWKNIATMISDKEPSTQMTAFSFYGPTCDSVDYMAGPFMLPDNITTGDWIAVKCMGAYTGASQTHFNGFYSDFQVEISN